MNEKDFRTLAIKSVIDLLNSDDAYQKQFGLVTGYDVYVVWECKTLQNNKALLGTSFPDRMYFEFTWNGDKQEGYLDAYTKVSNTVVKK